MITTSGPTRRGMIEVSEEAFRASLAEARRATFHAGIERVQSLTGRALETHRHPGRNRRQRHTILMSG
jgi:hypothetical protein